MKNLIVKPFLALHYVLRFAGVFICLMLINISNSFLYRVFTGKRNKKDNKNRAEDLPKLRMPELGKKLQQSFR